MTSPTPTAMNAASPSDEPIGAHHLTPESIAALVADMESCQAGGEFPAIQDRDWRTRCGVIARVIRHLADSAEQSNNLGAALDEYGEMDFGFTFSGIQLEAGDKRLASLIVRALGTAHPAMDDLTALLFRARSTPVAERAAAPASVPEDYKLVPITPDDEMTDAACEAGNLFRVDFIRAWDAALLAAPEVAQPAAQGERAAASETIVSRKFNDLMDAVLKSRGNAGMDALFALVDHINAWGASQRQEGCRDMHETNVALIAENCALVEKMRAREPLNVQQELWEFVAMLSLQSGGELNGNRLSARAKELLAKMEAPAPTTGEPSADELMFVGHEFLKWNRSQPTPPVAACKELYIARKVLEIRAAHIKATQAGKEQA